MHECWRLLSVVFGRTRNHATSESRRSAQIEDLRAGDRKCRLLQSMHTPWPEDEWDGCLTPRSNNAGRSWGCRSTDRRRKCDYPGARTEQSQCKAIKPHGSRIRRSGGAKKLQWRFNGQSPFTFWYERGKNSTEHPLVLFKTQSCSFQKMLKCNSCKQRFKSHIITRCMHLFCGECLDARIETRQRKCPTCSMGFGVGDVASVYFWQGAHDLSNQSTSFFDHDPSYQSTLFFFSLRPTVSLHEDRGRNKGEGITFCFACFCVFLTAGPVLYIHTYIQYFDLQGGAGDEGVVW